ARRGWTASGNPWRRSIGTSGTSARRDWDRMPRKESSRRHFETRSALIPTSRSEPARRVRWRNDSAPRLPTGVPGFDAMVQGGLPVGSSVVLQGPPGQEKLRFALTFLAEGLRSGGSGLVVTSSQPPDAVIAELRELGVNLDSVTNENRLRVIDWYSWS